ncbi:replication initiation protein [Inediibacterium massiliense]|nr:replication initiation protein [Inediibacterium massiliense]
MSKNYMVTKANTLIEASYKLTLGEQKLIFL